VPAELRAIAHQKTDGLIRKSRRWSEMDHAPLSCREDEVRSGLKPPACGGNRNAKSPAFPDQLVLIGAGVSVLREKRPDGGLTNRRSALLLPSVFFKLQQAATD
jgi:hypothetical protein